MRNLTQQEAAARARAVRDVSYDIELDLTHGEVWYWSTTTVRFTATGTAGLFLELDCLTMVEALLDGSTHLQLLGNRIALDGLQGRHEVKVVARCGYTRTGEGLHRFVDPADDRVYVYGNAFLDDAQRFLACFDQPDIKAPVRLSVTAPDGHLVRSNARGEETDGRWSAAYPHALRPREKSAHAPLNRVPSSVVCRPMNSAKDSLSQMPSHHRIVTRSPNHMCAISCAMTCARSRRAPSVVRER